jgi:hypothetical protein
MSQVYQPVTLCLLVYNLFYPFVSVLINILFCSCQLHSLAKVYFRVEALFFSNLTEITKEWGEFHLCVSAKCVVIGAASFVLGWEAPLWPQPPPLLKVVNVLPSLVQAFKCSDAACNVQGRISGYFVRNGTLYFTEANCHVKISVYFCDEMPQSM